MFKSFTIACTVAAVIAAAATMATAGAGKRIDQPANTASASKSGVVDCASQIWPRIDAYCLAPVSDEGEVRMARHVAL